MHIYSTIYKNYTTSIPKKIREKYDVKSKDTVQWTIDNKTKALFVEFINQDNLINKPFINLYQSRISQSKLVSIPKDITKIIGIAPKNHRLKWKIKNDNLIVEKIEIPRLSDLDGLITKDVI